MTAEANSFRAWPLREMAKEEGIHENDPLLLWALEAQEKADWRTNPASWSEMEAAVWAFIGAHFDVKGPSNLEEIPRKVPGYYILTACMPKQEEPALTRTTPHYCVPCKH